MHHIASAERKLSTTHPHEQPTKCVDPDRRTGHRVSAIQLQPDVSSQCRAGIDVCRLEAVARVTGGETP